MEKKKGIVERNIIKLLLKIHLKVLNLKLKNTTRKWLSRLPII
jgi:hypothetical protein